MMGKRNMSVINIWSKLSYAKIFLVEQVSSETQQNSKFYEYDKKNLYSKYIFTINLKNISKNLKMDLVILST